MSGFSSDWSDFTGDCSTKDPNGYQHKCCPSGGLDSDPVCPAKKTLAKVDGITIWSEGVGGNFALKIYEIAAVADATAASAHARAAAGCAGGGAGGRRGLGPGRAAA
jgi:hypothetical protein